MLFPSGRLETRRIFTLPIKLLDPREPEVTENGVTENVSRLGARVLVRAPKKPNAILFLDSPVNSFRTLARVVYCEPLSDGQFGIGLQLKEPTVEWGDKGLSRAASLSRREAGHLDETC